MNKWKKSRAASFAVVGVIYVLAAVLGILIYRTLNYDWWINLLLADVAATVFTFLFSVLLGNASVYDPYWSVQPIVILWAFATQTEMTAVRALVLIAVSLWGARLTANWAYTFSDLCHQDWRYTMLKEKTGAWYPIINFVGIHMVPTLVVYGCTLPAVYVMLYNGTLNFGAILGFCLAIGAVLLQGASDVQMHRFRKHRTGNFIRVGLWKYSRHPNYLAEILMWWAIALLSASVFPDAWYLAAGAFANTLLFLLVSIPMADGRQSRKSGFAEYKKETRMLLPIKK
ncbi:MAG: DUF1295 domain-containing protein [Clostridia bacterium]|nr:DUF1295 domain-containing protein [Clostridia bacterium]